MTSEGRLEVGDRTIAYLEAGDPDGALVLHDHGGPSSRLEALDTLVPEVINKTVADKTPGAVWHPVEDGGHFIAVSHANQILAVAANDLVAQSN
jgi:hypothetical protein